ncbi:hypothetical protein tb265_31280 [Gemmatimonadetes bacterium T265]|nr:hypothetical protein tb265_31280 [Gemmatimonadetes bacterium T265]
MRSAGAAPCDAESDEGVAERGSDMGGGRGVRRGGEAPTNTGAKHGGYEPRQLSTSTRGETFFRRTGYVTDVVPYANARRRHGAVTTVTATVAHAVVSVGRDVSLSDARHT